MDRLMSGLTYADLVGTIGTLIVVAAYCATQLRRMNSSDLAFPLVNLCGSLLIAFSLCFNFNLASALMEVFWIAISLLGIRQWHRERRAAPAVRNPSASA